MKKNLIKLVSATMILSLIFVACKEEKPDRAIAPSNVILTPSAATLFIGEKLQLEVIVLPENATDKSIRWTNSTPDVTDISNDGIVTAKSTGTAFITVHTIFSTSVPNSGGIYKTPTADCYITVVEDILEEISFASDSTWTVGNQTWSDAVQTTYCSKKTSFNGGSNIGFSETYNADCRSNPDYKGDLFSWEMIDLYQSKLCPSPWRVPTRQDFIDLDKALGGTGNDTIYIAHSNKYINTWGGFRNGTCTSYGALQDQGTYAFYWSQSQSEHAYSFADVLHFDNRGFVSPQHYILKSTGLTLRCVK